MGLIDATKITLLAHSFKLIPGIQYLDSQCIWQEYVIHILAPPHFQNLLSSHGTLYTDLNDTSLKGVTKKEKKHLKQTQQHSPCREKLNVEKMNN